MEHYFSPKQSSPLSLYKVNVSLPKRDLSFELWSASGLFSKKKLDKGTQVLLQYMDVTDVKSVLDLGCGSGVVGVTVLKLIPAMVTFVDVNARAIKVVRANLKLHKLKASTAVSDGFEKITDSFDLILLNPPQSAGKKVCERLVEESSKHLNENGHLQFVLRKNKGGESLSEFASSFFSEITVLAKKGGYWVYNCKK